MSPYLSQLTPTNIILGCAILIVLLFLAWFIHIERKIRKAFMGKSGASMEDAVVEVQKHLSELTGFTKEMEAYLQTVEKRLKNSTQAVETIRFNPFKGTGDGGNNSFSTAFLNQHGNGVVLTSMYARDRVSMFAKAVKHFASDADLSEEELEAIAKAKITLSN